MQLTTFRKFLNFNLFSGSQLAPPKTGTMIQMTQKERPTMDVVGNVVGKTCIIVEGTIYIKFTFFTF